MKLYDEKQREEIGFNDMDKYEYGGLEIESKLTNGYLMYIPYGIHVDVFNAIEKGIQAMYKQKDDLLETITMNPGADYLEEVLNRQVAELEKHIKVLEKITPIANEI